MTPAARPPATARMPAGPDDGWTLIIEDADPRLERVHESLLTLADGRLGTRGSAPDDRPGADPEVLMAGVYTGSGPETHLLSGPRWNAVDAPGPDPRGLRRVLDLRTGTLVAELDGGVQTLSFSSLARPATAVMRIRGRPETAAGAGGALRAPAGAAVERGVGDDACWMRVTGAPGSIVAAVHEQDRDGGGTRDRIACYAGTPAGRADERRALADLRTARALGYDALLAEHRRAWAARWDEADVRIAGEPELQLAVRLALFHLIASVADRGDAAVGARGLSGSAYHGHVFWDSEVYVLPFLAATHPPAARAMLEYRLRRLPAAIRSAAHEGRAGARFPWESAAGGDDVTPVSVRTARGDIDVIYTGAREQHIVADVAWAAAHYIDWTGDRVFADGPGLELLVQTARWWASRIERDADGSAHIRGVLGPDEYHECVDDDAYTNVMARWNLRRAVAADHAGAITSDERARWLSLAEALVDGFDPATGVYEQFRGFDELEPRIIAELAPHRPVDADMLLGHAAVLRAQIIKQPDVLMLHYLVPDEVAPGSLARNLDYYDPRTAYGSSLSTGVHAALLARAGRVARAAELLRLTARIDLDDIGGVTAGGLHLAAMGSVWRALVFGFAGVRPAGDALAVDPVLAPGWESLALRVRFRGSRVAIAVDGDMVALSAEPPVAAVIPGGDRVVLGRAPQRVALADPKRWGAR